MTPDRFPGLREDEAIVLEQQAVEPSTPGEIRNVDGFIKACDGQGVFDMRAGVGSINEAQHEALDTFTHRLAEPAYVEVVRDAVGRLACTTVWTDASRTAKVRDSTVTRDGQGRVAQIEERQFDGAGAVRTVLTTSLVRDATGRVGGSTVVKT